MVYALLSRMHIDYGQFNILFYFVIVLLKVAHTHARCDSVCAQGLIPSVLMKMLLFAQTCLSVMQ